MSSSTSSDSTPSKSRTRAEEAIPLMLNHAPPRNYGSLFIYYHLLRNSASASLKTLNKSDSMVSLYFRTLVSYISEDNLVGLRSFLDGRKSQVDDRDENNSTALIVAATQGKLDFVRELIRFGADVNAEDADSWTPLLCASKEGHLEVCRELLDHGAAAEHRDMASWTALLWAAYKGRTEVAELLISRGADVNVHENYHISPLHWACGRGHTEIARMLIRKGVKVNVGDKYGTTALIWACRKGYTEIVDLLLKQGANVDTAGMYSWTPLLVATAGNHADIVNLLLDHKPNVNALDKDGYTALALACKDGYHEIAVSLLSVGAYINLQDRSGDTNLILAVKGGHRNVVEALLKKYADVDTTGKDKRTAIYTAVEKGNLPIVKLLLSANPDLEITTKDGDTPLLRSVRSRNGEIVQLLLEKKAKVSATDNKGDTVLHIAMRARSKAIVEILLRNPKHSQLLYRPNKAGETPYNLDMYHQKTILGQIFGARRLNTNEDNENMLGYDLYSSALADILSEPSLSMPIIVGLFAKWGSGKSFLLNKLREEMKNFARQWIDPSFQVSGTLVLSFSQLALLCGVVAGLAVNMWLVGLIVALVVVSLIFTFLGIIWCCAHRYDWNWPYQAGVSLAKHVNSYRLILQVLFCHPPGSQLGDETHAQPIRFNFTDQTRISSTTGGENSVVLMLGSLYDSIELDYGSMSTRLFRAFRPKPLKATANWRWRKICCLPYIVIFEMAFFLSLVEVCLITFYFGQLPQEWVVPLDEMSLRIMMMAIGTLLAVVLVANIYTLGNMLKALVFSQRKHLQRTIARLETLKSEGFLQALKTEVTLMVDMVKCLDSFTQQQTRLVIVVDGLDSCEQDKVLMVLDAIHMLFADASAPFIVILAIDPHIISKAVELNSRRVISESNIGGHEYLRSLVHLPFFLANSALRKVKVAQSSATRRPTILSDEPTPAPVVASRRLSVESNFGASTEKLKLPSRKGSRKLKLSESIASSIGSNLNRIGGAQDLTKMLLTDDYFSDVNPRSMRRLLNVVYVTGRLLKAFQMEFNWYHLAIWINITEQWPYRTSWIILYYEMSDERIDDQTPLKAIYDEVRPRIPVNKDVEPLLEMDRDERKFDVFLSYHRSSLLLNDLKVFLPFTINLDPYIKKVIKEDLQEERMSQPINMRFPQSGRLHMQQPWMPPHDMRPSFQTPLSSNHMAANRRTPRYMPPVTTPLTTPLAHPMSCFMTPSTMVHPPLSAAASLPPELLESRLSQRSVDGVCDLIQTLQDLDQSALAKYVSVIKTNNINGRVLLHCDMEELKTILNMNFGDWEMFKILLISLREHELTYVTQAEEAAVKNVRFSVGKHGVGVMGGASEGRQKRGVGSESGGGGGVSKKMEEREDKELRRSASTSSKHNSMENQVTLEDQMICGALQTLNEEACEDVLEENNNVSETDGTVQQDATVLFLQSSPLNQPYWQAATFSVGDDQTSPVSSACATPVLTRRPSRHMPSRSRPSSLLLVEEPRTTPPSSPSNFISSLSASIKKKKPEVSPTVLITPVPSVEKINRIKEKILRKPSSGNAEDGSFSDDENTPLVSEPQTPNHAESNELDYRLKGEISPQFHETESNSGSDASISLILERSKSSDSANSSRSHFNADIHGGSDIDLKVTTRGASSRRLESQPDNNQQIDWDTPETSV